MNLMLEARRRIAPKDESKLKYLFIETLLRRNHTNYSLFLSKLEGMASRGLRIVLHGAGWHTSQILHAGSKTLIDSIVAITDSAKNGFVVHDFAILNPAELSSLRYDYICLSSDIHQKKMFDELLRFGVDKDKILDLYKVEFGEIKNLLQSKIRSEKTLSLLQEIAASKNPCIIVSNCISLNHLRMFKYMGRHYELFIVTSNKRVQSIDISNFGDLNFRLLDSVLDMAAFVSNVESGFIITINGIYWNSLGAVCTLMSKVPTFAWLVDILSSAYQSSDKLDLVCDAKKELFAEEVLWRFSKGVIYKESGELALPLINRYNPKNNLQFLDYCDGEVEVKEHFVDIEHIKFVYAGGLLSPKCGDPNCNHHLSLLDVARCLTMAGHEFAIYNAYDEGLTDDWDCYTDCGNEGFSYNHAVSVFELPKELSKYDIGVVLFNFDVEGVENKGYYKYGGFSKIMAYIEAELPIVISRETEFMASLIEKYDIGMALAWNEIPDFNAYITTEKINNWKKNIKRVKDELSYGANIGRLVDFLQTCKS